MSQQRSETVRRTRKSLTLFFLFITTVVLSLYTGLCSHRDYREQEEISERTDTVIWLTYISHAALIVATVRYGTQSLPISRTTASRVSNLLFGISTMYVLGIAQFESVDQIMGREPNGLVTGGIYSYSRNPQYTGWGLALLSVAVRKRAGLALIPVSFY